MATSKDHDIRPVQATEGRQRGNRVGGLLEEQSMLKAQNRSEPVKVNIKLPFDEDGCDIISCCDLGNGSLMIADRANSRLKLVDPSIGTVNNNCYTVQRLIDICCIGPQEFAYFLDGFGSTNCFLCCAACLIRKGNFYLGRNISKIACQSGLLYCVNNVFGKITLYVHDVSDGTMLNQINLKDQFPNFTDITVNGSGDRLYVTDSSCGLLCVNTYGQQIFHLSLADLRLSDAQGVTTDHRGHVFVCGYGSNNVVKVTEDGHVVGEILSERDGIVRPRCLSYVVSRSQLCVGGESDQILMVEWK